MKFTFEFQHFVIASYNVGMNQKTIIRLVIAALVAMVGAWQLQGNQNSGPPQHSGQHQGQHKNAKHNNGGASNSGSEKSNVTGDFDYYLVSLSWSPAYCVIHPQDQRQCGGKGFGFVLHGVWPQKSSGGYPEDCPATSQPSAAVIKKTLAFMPSEKLINHEWNKHGTCSGLTADEYLALADKAFGAIKIPTGFESPATNREMSADQIIAEFTAANPALPKDSLTLRCSSNQLDEVRVCVGKDLKPQSCGKGVRTQCGRDTVQIRSVR
jgi:ribonuclease T2